MPNRLHFKDGYLPSSNFSIPNRHMHPIEIRRAVAADAHALSDLALRTFRDTFAESNSVEDVAAHIAQWYSPTLQLAQIESPAVRTLLVEEGGTLIAYAQLRSGHVPDCVAVRTAIELWHFYVDRAWLGRGIAQRLMQSVRDEASACGTNTIWLGVWEHNPRAIAFYRKCGFREVGSHAFFLGSDRQTDLILVSDAVVAA